MVKSKLKPRKNNHYVILPEKEGWKRFYAKQEDLANNPTKYTPRDQRKLRLCPICSEYKSSMQAVPSEIAGKEPAELRQQFKSDMPFNRKMLVCCGECAERIARLEVQAQLQAPEVLFNFSTGDVDRKAN